MQRGNDIISLKADIILIILIYFQILDMFRLFLPSQESVGFTVFAQIMMKNITKNINNTLYESMWEINFKQNKTIERFPRIKQKQVFLSLEELIQQSDKQREKPCYRERQASGKRKPFKWIRINIKNFLSP